MNNAGRVGLVGEQFGAGWVDHPSSGKKDSFSRLANIDFGGKSSKKRMHCLGFLLGLSVSAVVLFLHF